MSRQLSVALLMVAALSPAAAREVVATSARHQGDLVVGQVAPGGEVYLDARKLRVSPQGWYVFGIGRDAHDALELHIRTPDGAQHRERIAVVPRDWPTERVQGVPEATVNPPPALAARIAREQARVAAARERDDERVDFADGFVWPVAGRISGRFGSQRIYNGSPRSPHSGVDVAAADGTPVHAPAAGVITFAAQSLYLTGGTVLLDHGHGVSSSFLHLSRIDVKVGDVAMQDQVIGAVGATGRASGSHLHWGLNWFDVRLDPEALGAQPRESPEG
jgi:murein DD-endopeptidase MepM/ murein hydrolase activator NlpD